MQHIHLDTGNFHFLTTSNHNQRFDSCLRKVSDLKMKPFSGEQGSLLAFCYQALKVNPVFYQPCKHFVRKPGYLFPIFPYFICRVIWRDLNLCDIGSRFLQVCIRCLTDYAGFFQVLVKVFLSYSYKLSTLCESRAFQTALRLHIPRQESACQGRF